MINGIHHPSIVTDDLDRALGFYRNLLGLTPVFEMAWEAGTEMSDMAAGITGVEGSSVRAVTLKAGNAFLEIFEYSSPQPEPNRTPRLSNQGIAHICFDVSDVNRTYEQLTEAGICFVGAPVDAGPMRIAFCQDPDGNFIEIQQITDATSELSLR